MVNEKLKADQRSAKLSFISRSLAQAMAPSSFLSLSQQARDIAYACDHYSREAALLSVVFENRGTSDFDVERAIDDLEQLAVAIVQLRNSLATHIQ